MNEEDIEKQVHLDHEAQQRWVRQLKSKMSMLKFRLPYCTKEKIMTEYEYLKGEIFLPIWGPVTTTETRLITDGKEMKMYNPSKYEKQMFYFNTKTRVAYYEHDVEGEGLDHCYDCMSEIFVLKTYLAKYSPNVSDVNKEIVKMSSEISKQLSNKRNLLHISKPNGEDLSNINPMEIERAKALVSVDTITGEKIDTKE
jgi:cap2 methyltransferase